MMSRSLSLALLTAVVAAPFGTAAPDKAKPAAAFTLTGDDGTSWAVRDQKAKAVVFAFLSPECPMSNSYVPALNEVAGKYADKGVTVVGVYPDPDVAAAAAAAHAKEYKIAFPVFRDGAQASVAALGAKVTPEVVVLDADRVVRYRGRINDGYVERLKPKSVVTRHDLAAALDEILAGKPVSVPETKAFGCAIPAPAKPAPDAPVTYYKDVLPVLQKNCQSCHRAGQVGPFALTSYKDAAKWAELSLEEVKAKRMPPWKPAANSLLTGERTLSAADTKTLEAWIAQGMKEGDPKDAPPAPKFVEGWTLGEPDLILEAPGDTVIAASGKDHFRVLVFPTNLSEDKYIAAMEVRPGNPSVVHHTLQMLDTTGRARKLQEEAKEKAKPTDPDRGPGYPVQMGWGFLPDRAGMLGGWAPGGIPKRLPDGVGQKLPKGADVCVQFHYHRTGKEEKDRTKIGVYFAKKPVTEPYRSVPVAGLFRQIPAGEKAFKVEMSWTVADDLTLYRLSPHMHLLGKDIELAAAAPGAKEQTLIRVPVWDYNWQEQYELKEPLKLAKGTVLTVRATFDNSAENPLNPSVPPKAVRFGEQTTDEMCFVFMGVASANPKARPLTFGAR
ncbi:MAG: redoxin family protein [Planctomycetes bacterium]|nr:redoxin family protein [Planctomycetota bacterium]